MTNNFKNSLGVLTAFAVAAAIACSGAGSGSGGNPSIQPASSGSIMDNVKSNQNCGWGVTEQGTAEAGCVWGKDGGKPVGAKTGRACTNSILGLIRSGDMSIAAAAKQGGITKVQSVDAEINSLLGSVLVESCLLVNGT
ncbi:TRL domain-containing protein [Leptospira idonii]|nr:TRL domain-containing protein [Leptospira idonii]